MSFTQAQLKQAFAQMQQERAADKTWAEKAALKLQAAAGTKVTALADPYAQKCITPETTPYQLHVTCHPGEMPQLLGQLAAAGAVMNNHQGSKTWEIVPMHVYAGTYDVAGDPDFSGHSKTAYRVHAYEVDDYYSSSGY